MQKDEWRKKLMAPGMNEAKEYDSIEAYHVRDDKKYRQKIDDTLRLINVRPLPPRLKSRRSPSRRCARRNARNTPRRRNANAPKRSTWRNSTATSTRRRSTGSNANAKKYSSLNS